VIRVQVIGVDAAIAKFLALGKVSDAAVEAGEKAGAEDVLTGAQARVPVDTGNLRDSLTTASDPEGGTLVGTEVDYAVFVEYGTSDTPAQPFLRPALDAEQADVTSAIATALNAAIRSVT
jgi:HK97 gp10 family phage protein